MLYPGFLGCVGQRFANPNFIAPGQSVDEGSIGADEQVGYELLVFEGTFDNGDILESVEFSCNGVFLLTDMCLYLVTDSRGDPADRSSLSAGSIDGYEDFVWHANCGWHLMSCCG